MYKSDRKAFIFTLKNPQGLEPMRFMNLNDSEYAIFCSPDYGPMFGRNLRIGPVLKINGNKYGFENCGVSFRDHSGQYDYHKQYAASLFVTKEITLSLCKERVPTAPIYDSFFSVLDYEVFGIDNYKDYVYNVCKHPDIIWKYLETRDIPVESLKRFDKEDDLRNDLETIHDENEHMRLKLSRYYFKNPSEFLPNTQIVSKEYDSYLKKWIGDKQMRLVYRASEHGYAAKSFHQYCDQIKPSLVVVKSNGGWIFGGFTTHKWHGKLIRLCIL